MTEENRYGQEETRAITAPDNLTPGQHFYDQPPFQKVLVSAAQQTGTDLAKLRAVFSRAAIKLCGLDVAAESEESRLSDIAKSWLGRVRSENETEQKVGVNHLLGSFRFFRVIGVRDPALKEKYKEAVRLAIKALIEYPLWEEYINLTRTREYLRDGTPRPQIIHRVPAVTYTQRAQVRQHAEENTYLSDI